MGSSSVLYNFDGSAVDYENPLWVIKKYRTEVLNNVYFYGIDAEPKLTANTSKDDTVLSVDSNSNVSPGDAITIYEGSLVFQSLVLSSTDTTITVASSIDNVFTPDAVVDVGPWNANVDGSSEEQIFVVKAPPDTPLAIKTVCGTILDNADMDDAKFGGITALTNGIIYRSENEIDKQFSLITNNTGFFENGFDISYSAKAPAGSYGFRFKRDLGAVNGSLLLLHPGSSLQLRVRDNLTDLTQFTSIALGFLVV